MHNRENDPPLVKVLICFFLFALLMFNPGCEEKPKNFIITDTKETLEEKDVVLDPKKHPPDVEALTIDISSYQTKANSIDNVISTQNVPKNSLFPVKKKNGKKWRIAYLEGGDFYRYGMILTALCEGLKFHGWINYETLPDLQNKASTNRIWKDFLSSARVESHYIEFVRDAFYTPRWDPQKRADVKKELIDRLNNRKDIDLVIAMGTWAGLDLANNEHSIPTVSMSVTDPVTSGIIPSPFDSGFDHFHARVDPFIYRRQLEFFHETVKFKRLGVCYIDYNLGWAYASMEDVIAIAKERNFEVIVCKLQRYNQDEKDLDEAQGIACVEKLIPLVDAIYISPNSALSHNNVSEFLEPILVNKIPTFVQLDSEYVQYGALMGMESNWQQIGNYQAKIIAQIFNGSKPGDLDQIFKETQNIAFNIKTAELIEFEHGEAVLSRVNKVFSTIKGH